MQFLSRQEALKFLELEGAIREVCENVHPDIFDKMAELAAATRRAYLFILNLNAVDEGMVREVLRLKRELNVLIHMRASNMNN